jgi:hypothetical protein
VRGRGTIAPLTIVALIVHQELGALLNTVLVLDAVEALQDQRLEADVVRHHKLALQHLIQELLEIGVGLGDVGVEECPQDQFKAPDLFWGGHFDESGTSGPAARASPLGSRIIARGRANSP